eukprot:686676-Rhodomonas_salina.1
MVDVGGILGQGRTDTSMHGTQSSVGTSDLSDVARTSLGFGCPRDWMSTGAALTVGSARLRWRIPT